ncbi:hypothetical protein BH23PLA1_BH23PLA1_40700 [soil metagenome]
MRKGLFALVLVLASFAGGAAVNGPGLQWAKDQLLTPVVGTTNGIGNGKSHDPDPDPDVEILDLPAAPPPPLEFPSTTRAAAPSSEDEDPAIESNPAQEKPADDPTAILAPPSVAAPRSPSIATGRDPESTAEEPQAAEASTEESVGDPVAPPRLLQPIDIPDALPVPGAGGNTSPATAPAAEWPDAPDSAPAAAVLPESAEHRPLDRDPGVSRTLGPEQGVGDPAPEGVSDWDRIRRRMEDLGVGRFWIEGQPDGPVLFRCVVPTVGGRVVSQHFEAEADDAIQAAEVALGRVALWRTTSVSGDHDR